LGVASFIVNIGANASAFQREMNKVSRELEKTARNFDRIGSNISKNVTVPFIAASGTSLKFAGDFEESLNKVSTIADETVVPIEDLSKGVLNLSNELGIAATDINEGLYQMISATGDTGNALSYLEIGAKAAEGGFTDIATSVDGLTTVMNAYKLKGTDAMQSVSDQMLTAQNYGKTTFGEMASSIGNVIPVASSLNVSTEDLFASIATLTKNGIQTSQAVTGLKAAYSNILKPSKQASELASELGLNFSAAHLQSVGWAQFLDEINNKTGGNAESMAQLFGSTEALNSVTVLATTGAEDFSAALEAMATSTGATEAAFSKMDQGMNDSLMDTLNRLKNAAVTTANLFLPAVNDMINKLGEFVQWFTNLDDGMKKNIITVIAVIAAIGPLFILIGKGITMISTITRTISLLSGTFSALFSPVVIIIGVIALLIGVFIYLFKTNEEFRTNVIAIWNQIMEAGKKIFGTLAESFKEIFTWIKGLVESDLNHLSKFWEDWGWLISSVTKGVFDEIVLIIDTGLKLITDFFIATIAFLTGDWDMFWSKMSSIGETAAAFILGTFENFRDPFINVWNAIGDSISNVWSGIWGTIKGYINKIISGVNSMIRGLNKVSFSVPDWVPGIGGKSFGMNISTIPMLANGGIVTSPTLSMIGEGGEPEAIIPLSKLPSYTGGGQTIVQVILDGDVIAEKVDNRMGNKFINMGGVY